MFSVEEVWRRLLAAIEDDGPVSLMLWAARAAPVAIVGDALVVAVSSNAGRHLPADDVRAGCEHLLRGIGDLTHIVWLDGDLRGCVHTPWRGVRSSAKLPVARFSFSDFVIGASNRFAHAAAFAVAEAPAKAYNPLFIYGAAGLGKTHLLRAVGHYTTTLYPHLQSLFVTAEQFVDEFIDAIANGQQGAFQRRYRDVDVLLVDDIQFLESSQGAQKEFLDTFNALHDAEKQIVISSDRPPKQIGQLEDWLRTRFEWGLITDIRPPDLETRLAILRKRSGQQGLLVPDDVLELIASRISSNVHALQAALLQVTAAGSLQHTEVNLHMAQLVLKDLLPDEGSSTIGVSLIMSETASYFGVSLDELCSTGRTRQLVNARQIAMYLARELTDLPLPKIGQAFGGRDHTTVMHANNKISGLMAERRSIYQQVAELADRIKAASRKDDR